VPIPRLARKHSRSFVFFLNLCLIYVFIDHFLLLLFCLRARAFFMLPIFTRLLCLFSSLWIISSPRGLCLPRRIPPFSGPVSDHFQGHLASNQREETEERPGRVPQHLCSGSSAHSILNQGRIFGSSYQLPCFIYFLSAFHREWIFVFLLLLSFSSKSVSFSNTLHWSLIRFRPSFLSLFL